MKKSICILLSVLLLAGLFSGCTAAPSVNDDRISVITTIFPEYDWVQQVLGENAANADVTMLLDNGVDLHSYQPTADDMIRISTCDLFIYVGGASDSWVDDALQEASNKDMVVLDLMDVLGDTVKEEEVVEGMQAEEHEHDHEDDEEHEDEVEYDEHIWLSLKNAETLVCAIRDALVKVDPEHKADYESNTEAYLKDLQALDAEYEAAVKEASGKTVLFADRFPFRYLTDDYGLSYYAAFVGCSAESEASFETIAFLSEKINELNLPAILTLENSNNKIAETVIASSGNPDVKILSLDSMQSTTSADVAKGVSYLSLMEKNLSVLKEALH